VDGSERHERLRNVVILRRDAFEVVERIADEPGIAIYADPPYIKSTRARNATRYLFEFGEEDHLRLAEKLRRFERARVVVSYYDDPGLEAMYPGWTKRLVYRQKNLHVQNRRGAGACTAPEVLLLNGKSYGETKNDMFVESEVKDES
jgi:site-specific DNA-adenine methylase